MSKRSSNRPKKAGIVTAKEKVDTTPPVEQGDGQQADWQERAAQSQPQTEDDELDFDTEEVPEDGDSAESADSDTTEQSEDQETEESDTPEEAPKAKRSSEVKLFMLTDYREFAKKGQVYTVDHQKADELIRLKRAVAYDAKQHKKASRAN